LRREFKSRWRFVRICLELISRWRTRGALAYARIREQGISGERVFGER
jgi:hypothetical protein